MPTSLLRITALLASFCLTGISTGYGQTLELGMGLGFPIGTASHDLSFGQNANMAFMGHTAWFSIGAFVSYTDLRQPQPAWLSGPLEPAYFSGKEREEFTFGLVAKVPIIQNPFHLYGMLSLGHTSMKEQGGYYVDTSHDHTVLSADDSTYGASLLYGIGASLHNSVGWGFCVEMESGIYYHHLFPLAIRLVYRYSL